jgi:phenylalanyl-tRNA synthetase beta subunit
LIIYPHPGDALRVATEEALQSGGITASVDEAELIRVLVPPSRSDVIHECDIAEDVAIAYG